MRMRSRSAWLAFLSLFVAALLPATADARGRVKVSASFEPAEAAPGSIVTLVIEQTVPPGYHTYAPESAAGYPTSVIIGDAGGLVADGELTYTKPKMKYDDIFEEVVHLHVGEAEFRKPFRVPVDAGGTISLTGTLDLQVCDAMQCVLEEPEFTATLTVAGEPVAAPAATTAATVAEDIPEPSLGFDMVAMSAGFEPTTARAGETVTLKMIFVIAKGRHLYAPDTPASLPTDVLIDDFGGLKQASAVLFPPPTVHYSEVFEEDEHYYEDRVVFEQKFEVPAGQAPGTIELSGSVTGQSCVELSCIQFEIPLRAAVAIEAGPPRGDAVVAAPKQVDDEPEVDVGATDTDTAVESPPKEESSLGAFLALAVFWGLFTLLMPCTYPMIPITISFFTKQAIQREGKVLPLSLTYGAGIVVIFVLIGVLLGAPIITFATHPVTNLVIGGLFLIFALALFGAINLQPPDFLMAAAGKASARGGFIGVFLMGATLVITSFTCTAPFVGSLLSVGASGGDLGRIALGMAVFGATMAVPFVFLSLVPGKLQTMPRAGEWMHTLKVFLGFVELAAALKFFSNADLVWDLKILSREVFLILSVGIFFCGASYLLGWFRMKGDATDEGIGPIRMISGVGSMMLALYLSLGVFGFVLDGVTNAIIPNYSSERRWGGGDGGGGRKSHVIIKDDLEAATSAALQEDKLLLINFTGFS